MQWNTDADKVFKYLVHVDIAKKLLKYESLWIRHTWTCKNVNTFIINWKKLWTCHMVNLMEVHKEALVHICLFYVRGKNWSQ